MLRVILLASVLVAAFIAGVVMSPPSPAQILEKADGVVLFDGTQVPEVTFINENGTPRSLADFHGRWQLLFFGYTYCPDVCPMTLMHMSRLWKRLSSEEREQLQVVLVSVDPARDTPESLAPYMAYFNPDFTALTGNPEGLKTLAGELNAFFARVDRDGDLAYLMDHSANVVLISPDGQYRGYIEPPHDPSVMLPLVRALLSGGAAD